MKKRIFSFLMVLAMVLAMLPVTAGAETVANGACGENLTWVLDGEGTLTISGTGAMDNIKEDEEEDAPWYEYKDSIKKIVIDDGVTSIGNRAFLNYDALTRVLAADSVTTIGKLAFYDCDKLDTVIAKGVTDIRGSAFSSCGVLSTLQIYNVVNIGSEAFSSCSRLTYQNGLKQLKTVGEGAFMYSGLNTITLPATVTYIAPFAFWGCSGLTATFQGNAPGMTDCGFIEASFASTAKFKVLCTATGDWRGYTVLLQHDMSDATCTAPKTCKNCSATEGTVKHTFKSEKCTVCGITGGQCGNNVYWMYQDKTLTLYGTGEMYNYLGGSNLMPWDRMSNIEHVVIEEGVTKLNTSSFRYCENLQDVVIADTVTGFGSRAFEYCESLKSITIPSGTTYISERMFNGCYSLETVVLPEGITAIGSLAFWNCISLQQITLPESLEVIGDQAFLRTGLTRIEIPASVKTVEAWAFSNCSGLTAVVFKGDAPTFGSTVSDGSFENKVFNQITTTVYYPADNETWTSSKMQHYGGNVTWVPYWRGTCGENVTWTLDDEGTLTISGSGDMEDYASSRHVPWYDNRSSIKKIVIREGITSIGDFAFYGCDNLLSVTIPDGLTTIGMDAFDECIRLTSVTIPDSVTTIGRQAFYNCDGLTSVTIPDGVTTIGSGVFAFSDGLISVTIPDSVTSIGYSAFYSCTNLRTVAIPNNVTAIDTYTFYYCTNLTSVTIPASVTSIDYQGFEFCYALSDVYFGGTQAQWNAIEINEGNDYLTGATLHTQDPVMTGVAIQTMPAKTVYFVGEALDITGLTLTATYSDGSTMTVTEGFTVSGFDGATAGTKTVMVTYETFTASFDVTVICGGNCGENVTWILGEDGTLTISGIGAMEDYAYDRHAPWYGDSDAIEKIIIEEGVTTVGDWAFPYCFNLTSVTMANTVTSIGDSAFTYCDGLTAIEIPNSVIVIDNYAFFNCAGLTAITIPEKVTSIGMQAFANCSQLRTASIPASVTQIKIGAFHDCDRLTRIIVDAENVNYSSDDAGILYNKDKTVLIQAPGAITECAIPAGTTHIGDSAFGYCDELTAITIPASVTSIGKAAFLYCYDLTDVYYEGTQAQWNEITIGDNNEDLTDATLHTVEIVLTGVAIQTMPAKTVYFVGEALDITSLTLTATYSDGSTMTVTEGFTVSGFDGATAGTKTVVVTYETFTASFDVTVICGGNCGENVTWILGEDGTLTISGTGAMYDYTSGDAPWYEYRTYIKKLVIEEGVTTIGASAFRSCDLTSVMIPGSVTDIGDNAFCFCEELTSVTIPGSVVSIGDSAFYQCSALQWVTISEGVTTIDDWAFAYCEKLTSVVLPNTVTTLGQYAFLHCEALTTATLSERMTDIAQGTFSHCVKLTSVTIPDGIISMGKYAFYATNLTSVTIPDSVTSINKEAFYDCAYLTDVYYEGLLAQWNAIAIDSGNDSLIHATLHTQDPVLTGIAIQTMPARTVYFVGEELDITGLTLTATYSDGSTVTITEGFSVSAVDMATAGTKAVMVTYEGCEAAFTVTYKEADASLVEASRLDIGNSLSVQFAVPKAAQESWTGFYAQVDHTRSDGSVKTTKIPYTDWYQDTNNTNYLVVSYNGVAAKEMTDEVKVTIFNATGKQIGGVYTDSIRAYVMRNFGKFGAKVDRLFADMLNYGAEAQKYFNNKENDLANALMNETQKGYATQTDPAVTNTATAGIQARLDLQYKIALQIAIPEQYKDQTITYSFTNQKGVASGEITAPVEVDRGVYLITVDAIVVGDARQTVTVKANGEEIFHDSVESYIARMSNTSDMADLCKAIMKFADAARDYFK